MKQGRCLIAGAFVSAFVLASIPVLGEVHFELNFGHTGSDYYATVELSATNPAPFSVYRVESPSGLIWKETDGNGSSAGDTWTNNFQGLLNECTNGLWTLILNHGEILAETNWFTVAATDLTTATFGQAMFIHPTYGETVTNNQPTLLWLGPSHLPELYLQVANGDYSFYEYDRPDSSTTSWMVPSPMPDGSYSALVNYEDKDFLAMSAAAPTNASGTLAGWNTKFGIASYDYINFTVATPAPPAPPTSLGTALEAYYLPWTTGGEADWFAQTNETWDGIDTAQSGAVGLFETSWIETTVTNEGIMQYWMYIDADQSDYVEITVNGSFYDLYDGWYGGWDYFDIYGLSAGDTIRWTFYNDDDTGSGQDAAFLDRVEFGDDELALAVDAPQWTWTTGGEDGWYPEWYVSPADIDTAMSGYVAPLGESWIETTVEGPGTLSFMWNIEVMENEVLIFELNGSEHGRIEGYQFWAPYTLELPAGPNTLRWTFVNDETEMSGPAFLDQVHFTPAATVEPDYEADLNLRISRNKNGNDPAYYSVYPYIGDYAPTNAEIEVVSPNEICRGTHYAYWHNAFTNLQAAIDECEAGPWTIYYDRNTPQEKTFTFTVSLPTLNTGDLPPVNITSPVQDAVGVSPNPDYTWTGPTNYTSIRANLYNVEEGGYIGHSPSLPTTATAWTNAPTAPEVTNRFTVTYNNHSYWDIEISEPLDASSNPLSQWNEWTWLESEHWITYEVGGMAPLPVTMLPPLVIGGNLGLSFVSQSGATHFVEWTTNLVTGPWLPATNFTGDGTTNLLTLPATNPASFYRIETQ
ncbi:hypothetical protein PDESU_05309 [Pontiella desulfatans]|uniref:Uncharacterized protein n=1 Tax=Pontiella desulfatans TaxID=2750659 RepID=A0A6C2U9E5_PONDE|nr:hypothetical protein [Pontiella desulfatans]VGO16718.1 hypothetical protein PDESU_05309 [Pontiella desulfatans]